MCVSGTVCVCMCVFYKGEFLCVFQGLCACVCFIRESFGVCFRDCVCVRVCTCHFPAVTISSSGIVLSLKSKHQTAVPLLPTVL